ncbi:MAG: nucleotidyltransferase family protein [Acetobacteraceae bacterium]
MIPLLAAHRAEIVALCRRFHVRRLEVFGSAARGTDFDPTRSDVDLLVTYGPDAKRPSLGEHFELHDRLEA